MSTMANKRILKGIFLVITLLLLGFVDDTLALTKITSIQVKDDSVKIDGTDVLRYKIDKADPFNIVILFDNVELANPQDKPFKSSGIISELRVMQSKDIDKKASILISLSSPADIDAKSDGNSLFVTIAKNPANPSNDANKITEPKKEIIKEPSTKDVLDLPIANEVIAVFMDKIDNGAELVIKGNGSMPEPLVYKLDKAIILEIENLKMKAFVPSTLILPFRKVSFKEDDNSLKFIISIESNELSYYAKKESDVDIDVRVANDEILVTATTVRVDKVDEKIDKNMISLNYINSNVKSILRSISDKIGYNLIIGEDVPDATVTIKQDSIHWKDAIKLIREESNIQISIDDTSKTIVVRKNEFMKFGSPKEEDLVSFEFQDADLSSVVFLLSEISGYNIVLHPDVKDLKYRANINIKKVPWQKALEKIVKIFALEFTVDEADKIITIAPVETINKIETSRQALRDIRIKRYKSESELYAERAKVAKERLQALMSEQKITKIIKLKYLSTFDAIKHITQLNVFKGVRSTVREGTQGIARQEAMELKITDEAVTAEVGISSIPSLNAIVIRHVPAIVEEVEKFLSSIDIPSQTTQQVLIEARVVEVTNTSAFELGVQWGVSGWGATRDGGILSFGGTRSARDTQSGTDYVTTPYSQVGIGQATQGTMGSTNIMPLIINMPAAVAQGAGGSFGIGYINRAASLMLDFRLSALEKAGRGKILSQPKVMTLNNSPSLIRHGARVPITTPGSTQGTYTTTYIDAALLMKVTPSIVFGPTENIIYLDLEISKDEPATSSDRKDVLGNPQIDSRAANTRVALRDGETVVIAGIRKETTSEGESSVPYLSKIPILGSLFKKEDKTGNTEELMIFVTPKIIQPFKQD
ncbi:MAG: hypothetical protein SNJ53_06990 [Thermodesulfovibrionales bacterium]